jgi:O-antigen/teichoic acid export membrane protein
VLFVVLTPYLVSELGPAGYGVWVLVAAATGILAGLDLGIAAGMSRVVSRQVARGERAAVREVVSDGLALGLAVALAVAAVAVALVPSLVDAIAAVPDRGEAIAALRLGVAVFVVGVATGVFEGVVLGAGRAERLAALRLGNAALFAVSAVAVLEAGGGLAALAAAQLGAMCCSLVAAAASARGAVGEPLLRLPGRAGAWRGREVLAASLPRQASRAWLIGALQYERYVAGLALGAAAAGGYGVASVLAGGLAMLLAHGTLPLIPALTRLAVTEGEGRAEAASRRAMAGFAVLVAGAFGLVAAVAAPLLAAWVGPRVPVEPRYLQLLCVGFAAWTLTAVGFTAAQALGRGALEARAALAGLAAIALAAPVLVEAGGADALAVGTTLGLLAGAATFAFRGGRALAEARAPVGAALAAAVPIALLNAALLDPFDSPRAAMATVAMGEALVFAGAYAALLRAGGSPVTARLRAVRA